MSYLKIVKLSSIERVKQCKQKVHYHDKAEGIKAVAYNSQGIECRNKPS